MSNDKFYYPQRSPPPEKNIPCVKRWGEVGFMYRVKKQKKHPPSSRLSGCTEIKKTLCAFVNYIVTRLRFVKYQSH